MSTPIGDQLPPPEPGVTASHPSQNLPAIIAVATPSPWPKLARWGFLAFAILVVVAGHHVIMPFALGMLMAFILAPVVGRVAKLRLGRVRVSRGAGVILVYIILLIGLMGLGRGLIPLVSEDIGRLVRETPSFLAKVQSEYIPEAERWLGENVPTQPIPAEPRPERKLRVSPQRNGDLDISLEALQLEIEPVGKGRYVIGPRDKSDDDKGTRLGELFSQAVSSTENQLRSLLAFGQRFVTGLFTFLAWFVLTFMVAAYLLIDLERVTTFVHSLVPPEHRDDGAVLLRQIERGLDGVIRGQLIICTVNGVLTTIGLLLFHVKYALLLGLIAGAMSFIPVFGSILSSVPIVLVALTSGDAGSVAFSKGFAMLVWILVIHFLEANVFNPKIIGDAAKMHPVLVVFSLLIGEESGGLLGALMAVPVASMVQAVYVFMHTRVMTQSQKIVSP